MLNKSILILQEVFPPEYIIIEDEVFDELAKAKQYKELLDQWVEQRLVRVHLSCITKPGVYFISLI